MLSWNTTGMAMSSQISPLTHAILMSSLLITHPLLWVVCTQDNTHTIKAGLAFTYHCNTTLQYYTNYHYTYSHIQHYNNTTLKQRSPPSLSRLV